MYTVSKTPTRNNRSKLETQFRPDRRSPTLLRLKNRPTQRTQPLILKHPAINTRPPRLRRQQTATQGAIRRATELQLTSHQMHPHFLAGEQIQLFVRLDQLIGKE